MGLGGAMKGASSLSGRCHTFDIKADGYIKAEGVNAVILKRLSDAVRDGDPIRAVIRGSATNSDGRTPGIASPSSEAQAVAIRAAYANAGITDLSGTAYLECHGTGTQVNLQRCYPPRQKSTNSQCRLEIPRKLLELLLCSPVVVLSTILSSSAR